MAAQGTAVWLDASAASARPPAGITAATALYGILGLSARFDAGPAGAADLSVRGGRSGSGETTGWAEGEAGWSVNGANRRLAWGLRASGFGLDYTLPFRYRAGGAALEPRLSFTRHATTLSLHGDLRAGGWSRGGLDSLALDSARSGALGLAGGAATLSGRIGPVRIEAGGEAYQGALDGWFAGPLATASITARGGATLTVMGRSWSTPVGRDNGLDVSLDLPAGDRAIVRAQIGRTQLDPLYGTPGSWGGSLGVVLRLASGGRVTRPNIAELRDTATGGRVTRFRFHAPTARSVAVAGDFTAWQPRPMVRRGGDWIVELTVAPGVHHFAFLVNGRDWAVPGDAPGVSTDEWGRKNATLVVDS